MVKQIIFPTVEWPTVENKFATLNDTMTTSAGAVFPISFNAWI